ncbi:hypothetical protein [Flavobacterium sp. N3904]|uniref:hypothetical protein n=1 Tax=Flavobacterium sp. N3904 TaxID=2986835 RepID=UPI00222451AF|nr:hypothetical protein [Flavobacterium sp. N3904]
MITASTIIRRLSLFSLLILFFPFFQTCSDKNIIENPYLKGGPLSEITQITVSTSDSPHPEKITVEKVSLAKDSNSIKEYHLSFDELREKKLTAINLFNKRKSEMTSNGYELGSEFLKDASQMIYLPFTIVIALCLLSVYLSYKEKFKLIFILSISNFCLLIIPLILFYMAEYLEEIAQIKFGYYMLLSNQILINYFSFKEFRNNKNGI